MNGYYKVSEFAKMLGISAYTLRKKEKIGELIPAYRDEKTGYRYYTQEQYNNIVNKGS